MSIVWKDIVELATLSLLYDGRPVEALGFVDSVVCRCSFVPSQSRFLVLELLFEVLCGIWFGAIRVEHLFITHAFGDFFRNFFSFPLCFFLFPFFLF